MRASHQNCHQRSSKKSLCSPNSVDHFKLTRGQPVRTYYEASAMGNKATNSTTRGTSSHSRSHGARPRRARARTDAYGRDGVRVRPAARGGARGTARCAQSRPARAREKRSPPQLPDHALPPSTSPLPAQVARWPSCGASSGTRSTRSRCPIRRRTPRSRVCCATRAPESCGFSSNSRGPPRSHRRAKAPRSRRPRRTSRVTRRRRSRVSP